MLKRNHTDAEIRALADRFGETWSEGQVIRSWLRQQSAELRKLVREEDWSWANIGKALSAAGIQFKTGKGWTGENIRRAVDLATRPKKARKATTPAPFPAIAPSPTPPATLAPSRPAGEPEFKIIQRGPGSAANRGPAAAGAAGSNDGQGQSTKGEP